MNISKNERQWVIGFALVILTITTIPYLMGFQIQQYDPEWRFSGLLFGIEDGNSYIAKMLKGASGDWLFRTPYTAYEQKGMLAFLPYMLIGKLSSPPGQYEQLISLFHAFRAFGCFVLVFAVYDFLSLFIQTISLRRLGLAVVMLGGGVGWLAVLGLDYLWSGALPGMDLPLEFYSPESFGFLIVFGLPHLAFSRAFLLWSLMGYLDQDWENKPIILKFMPGFLCFGIGLFQPLVVVVEWAIILSYIVMGFVYTLYKIKYGKNTTATWDHAVALLRRSMWIVLPSAPIVVYNFLSFRLDPVLRGWEGQNLVLSPPFHHYLLAYGAILPLSLAGIWLILKESRWRELLFATWIFIFPILAYAPINLQRRMPEAIWIAFTITALVWIESRQGMVRRWLANGLYLAFPSTVILILGSILNVINPHVPVYRPTQAVLAFKFLEEHSNKGDVVLAGFESSSVIPAYAPVSVLLGNGPESINLKEIEPRVRCFYSVNCDDSSRLNLIREFNIRFIFWGPMERDLGDWDPRESDDLIPIYTNGDYFIFEHN